MPGIPTEKPVETAVLRVGTFNVRQDADQGENHWQVRRARVADLLRAWNPDVVGLQEPFRHQLDDILQALPDYACVGVGRDDGRAKGEFCPILYRRERFAALEGGTFWLSEEPDTPGSRSWGAHHPRICSWVRLEGRGGLPGFMFYSTHLDNGSQEAREKGATLLAERIARRGAMPAVLVGDFNAYPDNPAIAAVTGAGSATPVDALALVGPDGARAGTYHGFTGRPEGERIDFIFVSPHWQVLGGRTISDEAAPYASDHFPVAAELTW